MKKVKNKNVIANLLNRKGRQPERTVFGDEVMIIILIYCLNIHAEPPYPYFESCLSKTVEHHLGLAFRNEFQDIQNKNNDGST